MARQTSSEQYFVQKKNVQRLVLPTARVRLFSIRIHVYAGCFFINKLHFTIVNPFTLKSD